MKKNNIDEKYSYERIKRDYLKKHGKLPNQKNIEPPKPKKVISYSGVILKENSRRRLLSYFEKIIPKDWKVLAHHMTIQMGEIDPKYERYIGLPIKLLVIDYAFNDRVICAGVESPGIKSKNKKPHITIAINEKAGAKPKESNDIPLDEFKPLRRKLFLTGVIEEVPFKI